MTVAQRDPDLRDRIAGIQLDLASKLGEGLAQPGESLMTAEARAGLGELRHVVFEQRKQVSGLDLTYYSLRA